MPDQDTIFEKGRFFPDKKQGERILVPGVLKGLHAVWKDYGRLKWASLWEPCIKLARQGFKVHESLANAIKGKGYHIRNNKGLRYYKFPNFFVLLDLMITIPISDALYIIDIDM